MKKCVSLTAWMGFSRSVQQFVKKGRGLAMEGVDQSCSIRHLLNLRRILGASMCGCGRQWQKQRRFKLALMRFVHWNTFIYLTLFIQNLLSYSPHRDM